MVPIPTFEDVGRKAVGEPSDRANKNLPPSFSSTMSPSSLIGKTAPTFTLKNHDDTDYEFKAESGTPTAIFFYPKSGRWQNSRLFTTI